MREIEAYSPTIRVDLARLRLLKQKVLSIDDRKEIYIKN
jgi:hypothetical protein